jgi:quercetin dioxygenase-like cupin family protein
MGIVHKFTGRWGEVFGWAGSRVRRYDSGAASGVTETWLIGKAEQARNYALRYYEVEAGGHTKREAHEHDHGLVFLCGQGQVLLGDETHDVAQGDVVYIAPNLLHEIANTGPGPLGFLCIIPATRAKEGRAVWAEEGLEGLRVAGQDASD